MVVTEKYCIKNLAYKMLQLCWIARPHVACFIMKKRPTSFYLENYQGIREARIAELFLLAEHSNMQSRPKPEVITSSIVILLIRLLRTRGGFV